MKRCKKCRFPLEGILARLFAGLFGCRPTPNDPGLCERCATSRDSALGTPTGLKKDAAGTYTCQICNRSMEESTALIHVKAEEYLLELIRKDHPEWKEHKDTCPKCVDYYRELIKKAKI